MGRIHLAGAAASAGTHGPDEAAAHRRVHRRAADLRLVFFHLGGGRRHAAGRSAGHSPDAAVIGQFPGQTTGAAGYFGQSHSRGRGASRRSHRERTHYLYENCFFCHGDALQGKGHFAQGFNPAPADFQASGTIAQLSESYLFWRIAKGGPGLPSESTPWDSAMPVWEDFLTEEEIWQVIAYLYDTTGHEPRVMDHGGGDHGGGH